ncbi:hypothetical protein BpHYR1_023416 [Brachionus plicatilis]|uniref:Uncharacterized protein n=1 Tax=Brachionus plicatilis TaxID=10195 RepID=A0A3M7QZZ8_BRAPC|nr:hypothetical protein BpHYR1_023416 [Brachionus plicatilis]
MHHICDLVHTTFRAQVGYVHQSFCSLAKVQQLNKASKLQNFGHSTTVNASYLRFPQFALFVSLFLGLAAPTSVSFFFFSVAFSIVFSALVSRRRSRHRS